MLSRRLVASSSIFVFLIVLWLIQNSKFISASTLQSLIFMNNSSFGYSSYKAYALFYTIPFIFLFNYFFQFEKTYIVTRKSREKLYLTFIMNIFIVAFFFSMTHMVVNDLLSFLFMDRNLLIDSKYLTIGILNMIVLVLYFLWIGILYRIIYDISNSQSLSMFITYLIVGSIYFLELLLFPVNVWNPFKDLNVFQSLLENTETMNDVLLSYVRQFVLGLILYLVGSSIYLKKDII